MRIDISNKIGAKFKLFTHKGDGIPTNETEWFHNIVLDSGFERMKVGVWANMCVVGTGNSQPAATQIQLDSLLANTTAMVGGGSSGFINTTTPPFYYGAKTTYRFNQGVAAGNISEVGVGWGASTLWNRALVKDVNGNPTTITVLSDEYLDVLVEIRIYPSGSSGEFELRDKVGSIISTHSYNCMPFISAAIWSPQAVLLGDSGSYQYLTSVYSGAMGELISSKPTGELVNRNCTNVNTAAGKRATLNLGLSDANASHKSFLVCTSGLMSDGSNQSGFKLEINPPIKKLNTQTMSYTFELSWGRYEPT